MKIDKNILKDIRDNFIKEFYQGKTLQEIALFNHIEVADSFYLELSKNPNINSDLLEDVGLDNLYKVETEFSVVDGEYDEQLILLRNNGKIPLGLTIEQLNAMDLGYYSWIEYGELDFCLNNHNIKYYDLECIEGSETLFELPYFKRYFTILKNYLTAQNLIKNDTISTNSIDVILEYNEWFKSEYNKYNCLLTCINKSI